MIKSLSLLSVLLLFSCSSKEFKSEDVKSATLLSDSSIVVSNSVFTSGIEGPAVGKNGDLFIVNIDHEGTIARKQFDNDSFELFVELPKGSIGNGIRFDKAGNMYIADYPKHNVLKIEYGTKHIEVYAHDSTMNQPNDLAIMDNGILLASDPNWGESSGNLWRVDLNGSFILLEDSMGTTNGIEVSSDNKTLYVNESIQKSVWAFDLNDKGEISNKRLFKQFSDFGMDGMRCDKEGNLYIARYGAGVVIVLNPKGETIRTIQLNGSKPTNVAFGGVNGDIVYVTMQEKKWVESFRSKYPGRNF
jgi:sugar lactone lactonase YvrE